MVSNQTKEETMEKLSQTELINKVAADTSQPKNVTKAIVDSLMAQIIHHVEYGTAVQTKLGKFYPMDIPARTRRNPRTGETVEIPANCKMAFKVAAGLKKLV